MLGAVLVVTCVPDAGTTALLTAATAGSVIAFTAVYGLSRRGGLNTDRLILIGIAFWYRSFGQMVPAAVALSVEQSRLVHRPGQLPAGLAVALIATPSFIVLLLRSRT